MVAAVHTDPAESAGGLAASGRRVVTAADEARRKIERDLHDGTQQGLVTLALKLRQAYDSCPGPLEIAAYHVVSEALANAAKHSGASAAEVAVTAHEGIAHAGSCGLIRSLGVALHSR
jgi:signal transduction histidine kinase